MSETTTTNTEDQEWIEICECEIDWKCGLCTEAGAYHSKLDA